MEEKLLQRLDVLTEKLGTTVEHLWPSLLKATQLSAAVTLCVCAATLALCCWGGIKVFSFCRKCHIEHRHINGDTETLCVALSIVMSILAIVCVAHICITVPELFYPELRTLKVLLK